ncbi:MAG: ATP-binding protein [Chitinophagales bacterium]
MSIELQQLKNQIPYTKGKEKFQLLFDIIEKMHFSPIDEADRYIDQMLNLARELHDEALIIKAYRLKCTIYGQQGKLDLYKETIFQALEMAQKIKDKVSIVKTLQSIGNYYVFFVHQFEKARHYLFQALDIAENIQDEDLTPLTHTILASSYGHQNKYDKSMHHSLLAIEGFKKNGDKLKLAVAYNHISYYLRDKNQAIKYAELALEISKEIGNLILQHDNYLALSIYHNDLKQFEKAVYYSRKCIEVSQKTKSSFSLAQGYSFLIKSLLNLALQKEESEKMKLLKEAEQYCIEFEQLIDSVNDKKFIESSLLLNVRIRRSRIHYHSEKYSLALKTLEDLVNFEQFKSAPIADVYDYMHRCHKALGNFEQALHYYHLYAEMVFDKKDDEALKHAEKLQTEYETKEKEKEVERLQELEVLKTRFFTQITHELRTPLTLIQGPAQQILDSNDLSKIHTQAHIIDRNANRLLHLVNQLLYISKIEAQKMELKLQHGSISNFIAEIVQAFQALAIKQQIQLDFITHAHEDEEILVLFDADKIEKILYNLLSNAFKFTPTQGRILCQLDLTVTTSNGIQAQLIVEDTGKGIDENSLPHIFDRFYQADSSHTRQVEGTGIGLALVKELTELLEGTIEVDSTVGKGTIFTLQLPLQTAKEQILPSIATAKTQLTPLHQNIAKEEKTPLHQNIAKEEKTPKDKTTKAPILLLVEDNPDIHTYIRSILENEYIILQAYNGEEGLQMAQERIPDLTISDVMMPLKDGYELCADLKKDERTSHIPVILLTAKAALKSRIEGFEHGADAYIAKPFHADELRLQSKNLLTTRNNQQRKYQQITLQHQAIKTAENPEQRFLKKVIMLIEKYIDDENLNVNRLSELLYMSNSQLYRKIQALTNYTVTQFIRNIRLAKAKAMLENGEGNVSEVAFNVGLTPSYFSRCFRRVYGFAPKELVR